MKKTFVIEGTHCHACKALIEDVCNDTAGVQFCNVNFETGETEIEYDESLDFNALIEEIEKLGNYKVNTKSI